MEHLRQKQQNNSRWSADDMKRTSSDSNDDTHAASALIRRNQLQQLLMFKDLQQQQQTLRVIERPTRTKRSLPNIPSTVAQQFCSTAGSNSVAVRPAVGVAGERSICDQRNPALSTLSNAASYAEYVEPKEEPHCKMPPEVKSSCKRLSSVSDQRDKSSRQSTKNKVTVVVDCDSDENESLSDVVTERYMQPTDCYSEPSHRSLGRTTGHQLQSMSAQDDAVVAVWTSSRQDLDSDGDRTPTVLNGRFRSSVISSSQTNCLNICQLAEVQVDDSDDDQYIVQGQSAALSLHDIMGQGYFLHPLTLLVASGRADNGVDAVGCFSNQAIVTACLGNDHDSNPTSVWHRPLLVVTDRKHIAANNRDLNDTATFRNDEYWIKKEQQKAPVDTMVRAGNAEKARNKRTLVAVKSLSDRIVTVSGVRPLTDGDFLIEINGRYVVGYTATEVANLLSDAILSSQPLHVVVASTTSTVETDDKELNAADAPSVCDDNEVHRPNALNSCQSKLSSETQLSQYYSQDSTSRTLDNNPCTLSASVRRINTPGTGNDMPMKTSRDSITGTVMNHPDVTKKQADLTSQQATSCLDRKQRTTSVDYNAINENMEAADKKVGPDDDVFFHRRGDSTETAPEVDHTPAAIEIACNKNNAFDQRADPRSSYGSFSSIPNKIPYCDDNVDRGFKTGYTIDNSPRAPVIEPQHSNVDRQLICKDLNDDRDKRYHCQNLPQQHIRNDSSSKLIQTHCYVNDSFNSSRTDPADVRRAAAAATSAARFVPVSDKATISDDSDCADDDDETDDDWIQETVYDDEYGWHCVTAV